MGIFSRRRDLQLQDLGFTAEDLTSRTLWQDAWRRLKKNKLAIASLIVIALITLVAIFAPLLAPYDPYATDIYMGTDSIGRDVFSRIIYGTRISLLVGVICEAIAVPIGVILGCIAGYYGGWLDTIISRLIEVLGSFPFIIFALCIMFLIGPGVLNIFVALGAIGWLGHARQIRAAVIQLKNAEFVEAAKAAGATDLQIIFKHLVPNCLSTVIVVATIDIPGDIMYEATLSYIGLGIQPPEPSWGSMIAEAQNYLRQIPTFSIFPGLAIMIVVLAFNTFGDGLRDALDPKLKNL